MEIAASLVDWIKDLNDVWDDCNMSQRLGYARSFIELCTELEAFGFLCHMGHHKQVLREKNRRDLVFVVGLFSIQAKQGAEGKRYGLVQLEGNWETTDEDRVPLPDGFDT